MSNRNRSNRHTVHGVPTAERRVGNVGLLIIQAAKQGSKENLEFLLTLPGAKQGINFTDKVNQTPLIIAAKNGHYSCVKLLISHGAELRRKTHRLGQNQEAWQIARRAGQTRIATYIQQCLKDRETLGTTRAQLERTLHGIAANAKCSSADLERFSVVLQQLIKSCEFDVNCSDDDETPLLLIRATAAGNIQVVLKLLCEFHATPLVNDIHTGESLLHIACKIKSKLRFFYAKNYPELLRTRDCKGAQPLHVACSKNDVGFVSWLFKSILAEDSAMDNVQGSSPNPIRRIRSLPDINDSNPPSQYSPQSILPSRKSANKLAKKSYRAPFDIISPLTSLPVRRVQRPISQDYTDGELIEDGGESPFDSEDGGGLTFSFESTRSHTISVGSSKSNSSRSRSNSPSNAIVNGTSDFLRTHRRARSAQPFESSDDSFDHQVNDQFEQSAEESRLLNLASILKESPLKIIDVVEIRPFSVTMDGDSIFHILAREGYTQLLTLMLKVAEFVRHRIDLKVLVIRDRFSARLPIEEAIHAKNVDCVRIILQFTAIAGLLHELLGDQHLLKNAVFTNDLDIVKVLIEYGFHKGLSPAISLAMMSEYNAILRVLLHYQTQVVNALEFSRIKHSRRRTLDRGGIKWVGFQLESVNPSWLYDCFNAVDSVSRALNLMHVFLSADDNHRFFQQLGRHCIHYFSEVITSSPSMGIPQHLTQITEVNLNENQLATVPVELFQLPSLLVLQLSHNQLTSLPSSDRPWERLYTSRISKLELDWNRLQTLPEGLFRDLANSLTELSVECNSLQDLPPGLWVIPKLKILNLAKNNLSRLHYLSSPQYFNDPGLTTTIASSFTVNNCVLECTKPVKDRDLEEIEEYLIKLADYHYTVCAAKFCACKPNECVMDEVMGIHLCRMVYFHQSGEGDFYQSIKNPVIQGQPIFPTNMEEESDSPLCQHNDLEIIDLSYNSFTEIPWDLPCIAPQLKKLHLQNNQIQDLDLVHSMPRFLETLELDKNQVSNLEKQRPMSLPCGHPLRLLALPENNMGTSYCRHCKHNALEKLGKLSLEHNCLTEFPVVRVVSDHSLNDENHLLNYDSFDYQPLYPNLSILSLEANHFTQFPKRLHHLNQLSSLNLSHNGFHEIPPEAGLINYHNLLILKLEGMFINNVPHHLLKKPTPKLLLSYLKALLQNSKPYRRIKLMVVGEGNKGKTSLLINLTKKGRIVRFKEIEMSYNHVPLATVGVELGDWEYAPRNKNKVTFMTWDFGGQEEYYATHQCFLTKRSLYLLVWNVQDGKAGVRSLKTWLENIEGCAPKSPVIIVGTHLDTIHPSQRVEKERNLRSMIQELYVDYSNSVYRYPKIQEIFFGNCHDNRHMDRLRDYIYNFVSLYKPYAPAHLRANIEPLLEQPIPASYIKLQDIVRSLAHQCKAEQSIPIFNKEAYRTAVREAGYTEKLEELEQATTFLHENGILLHFDDSSLLSDLYFLDPQWLCSTLAKVITVQQKNPFQRMGFMLVENLAQILQTFYVKEFLSLMQKFEVILLLDEKRLLIPSLLPPTEQQSCLIFSKKISDELTEEDEGAINQVSSESHAPLCQTPYRVLTRYYLLPFIPKGFFTRVTARLISSDIVDHLQQSIVSGSVNSQNIFNSAHWKCWRDGIIITWNHMEIFRIAPISFPLPGTTDTHLISSEGDNPVETYKGVEINVAVLPEEIMEKCSIFPKDDLSVTCRGMCMATWLLHQATTIIDSVFEDWYEVFAKKKGFDYSVTRTANPCSECFNVVHEARYNASTTPTQQRVRKFTISMSDAMTDYGVITGQSSRGHFYMFSSAHCSRAVKEGTKLTCPMHKELMVSDVAPDVTFCDFPPALVFTDPSCLILMQQLGDGGFGSVFKACLSVPTVAATTFETLRGQLAGEIPNLVGETESLDIAVKEFRGDIVVAEQDPNIIAEVRAWDIYQKASLEARVMVQLRHPHILGLVGLTLQPLRLLVELAPLGDLKRCVKKFKRAGARLSRKTLQTTVIQVAEALNYLHSRHFVYRDLKPENVLVWKFPDPDSQWDLDASIWVKVADYGISKQVSPQGLRGVEGTRPYLPPEVILHGGREAYSTKIDVYAFGMFMYYLITFLSPFESEGMAGRPITALLEECRRPELPAKFHPQSLQLYELMCWCWSDKPQHRPTFDEVLRVIKTDSFTHLLEATPITRNHDNITAACISCSLRQNTMSIFQTMSVGPGIGSRSDTTMSYHSVMSMLSTGNTSPREDTTIQVWYGTENGTCGVVNFHKSTTNHAISIPGKPRYISCLKVICGYVWVCSVGNGIHVYNTNNIEVPYASWGQDDKQQVYTLLYVEETDSVLALARTGMYAFNSNLGNPDYSIILEPRDSFTSDGEIFPIEGVVIPPAGNVKSTEVWVCSQTGHSFNILHPETFRVQERIDTTHLENQVRKVRHLQPIVVNELSFLAVANRHLIERWDVENRLKIDEFDVMTHCKEFYDDQRRLARVTSVTVAGDLLYVGTGGGVLLALNCSSMDLQFVFHAYVGPVRSLLLVLPEQQTRAFVRLFSRKDSVLSSINSISSNDDFTTQVAFDQPQARRRSSLDSLMSQTSRKSLRSYSESLVSERSVLISCGVGYRGVVGNSENCPPAFTLPSDGKKILTKPAKPSATDGHLLLWSTEHCSKFSSCKLKTASSFQIDDIIEESIEAT